MLEKELVDILYDKSISFIQSIFIIFILIECLFLLFRNIGRSKSERIVVIINLLTALARHKTLDKRQSELTTKRTQDTPSRQKRKKRRIQRPEILTN